MRVQRSGRCEQGQIIILFGLTLLVILGMLSFALDGSYGLVRERQDQNAADFASLAATQLLAQQCPGPAAASISEQDVWNVVKEVIKENSDGTSGWTAEYLTADGVDLGVPVGDQTQPHDGGAAATTVAPPPACGVSVKLSSSWNSFLARVIGQNQLSTGADAAATNRTQYQQGAAIDSLNPIYPHSVLAGGSGTFIVDGDIFLNSQRGTGQTDVIDAKSSSNIFIYGRVNTLDPVNNPSNRPIDWCFRTPGGGSLAFPLGTSADATNLANQYRGGVPARGNLPAYGPRYGDGGLPYYPQDGLGPLWGAANAASCEINSSLDKHYPVLFAYNQIQHVTAGAGDPFSGVLPDPFATGINCPYITTGPYASIAAAGFQDPADPTAFVLKPGEYTFPVELGPNVKNAAGTPYTHIELADCSMKYENSSTPPGAACSQPDALYPTVSLCLQPPGFFRFDKGLLIDPNSSQSVQGNNVMLAVDKPLPNSLLPGNVQNSTGHASGRPCLPANVYGIPEDWDGTNGGYMKDWDALQSCSSPGLYAASGDCWCWDNPPGEGPGTNESFMVAGEIGSQVNFTPPQSDNAGYADILLYQRPSTWANWGLNAVPVPNSRGLQNKATVTLSGVLYNGSLKGSDVGNCSSISADPDHLGVPCIGFNSWDNGVPYYPGGTLQTGYGAAPPVSFDGTKSLGWIPSSGTVTIQGVAVVSDFNTDGDTTISVRGKGFPYLTPGPNRSPALVG